MTGYLWEDASAKLYIMLNIPLSESNAFYKKGEKSCKSLTPCKNDTLCGTPNAIMKQCFANREHS